MSNFPKEEVDFLRRMRGALQEAVDNLDRLKRQERTIIEQSHIIRALIQSGGGLIKKEHWDDLDHSKFASYTFGRNAEGDLVLTILNKVPE